MSVMPLPESVIQRLAWTLVHFVWQGLAIALLLLVIVRLARVRRPALRYAISLGACQ